MPTYDHSLQLKRDNNQFLISVFYNSGYRNKQLIKLNRCRHYLQVDTLADIADGTGDQIDTCAYAGVHHHHASSSHDWP